MPTSRDSNTGHRSLSANKQKPLIGPLLVDKKPGRFIHSRFVTLYADHLEISRKSEEQPRQRSIPLLPSTQVRLVEGKLFICSAGRQLLLTKAFSLSLRSAKPPNSTAVGQLFDNLSACVKSMAIEAQAFETFRADKEMRIVRIVVAPTQDDACHCIHTRVEQEGRMMWTTVVRSVREVSELYDELAFHTLGMRQTIPPLRLSPEVLEAHAADFSPTHAPTTPALVNVDNQLDTLPRAPSKNGRLTIPHDIEDSLHALIQWAARRSSEVPRPLLHLLGLDTGSRFDLAGARLCGWGYLECEGQWSRKWLELAAPSPGRVGGKMEHPMAKITWRAHPRGDVLGVVFTGRDGRLAPHATLPSTCLQLLCSCFERSSAHDQLARSYGASSLMLGGRASAPEAREVLTIDLENEATLAACEVHLRTIGPMVPCGVPHAEDVVLCALLHWTIDELPKTERESWLVLSQPPFGPPKLRAFHTLAEPPQKQAELLEWTLGAETEVRHLPKGAEGGAFAHHDRLRLSRHASAPLLVRFEQVEQLSLWSESIAERVDGSELIVGHVLEPALMRALAEYRSEIRSLLDESTKANKAFYDALLALKTDSPAAAMMRVLTSRFSALEGAFATVQGLEKARTDAYITAWFTFMRRLLHNGTLTDDSFAVGVTPARIDVLRTVVLGVSLAPLAEVGEPTGEALRVLDALDAWCDAVFAHHLQERHHKRYVELLLELLTHPPLPASTDEVAEWCGRGGCLELPTYYHPAADGPGAGIEGEWEQIHSSPPLLPWRPATSHAGRASSFAASSAHASSADVEAFEEHEAIKKLGAQLQIRMLLHPQLITLLRASQVCAPGSRNKAKVLLSELHKGNPPTLVAPVRVELEPLREGLTLCPFILAAPLCFFDNADECKALLIGLQQMNLFTPSVLAQLLERLWGRPMLRPVVSELLDAALLSTNEHAKSDDARHLARETYFMLGKAGSAQAAVESHTKGSEARAAFACLESLLVAIGRSDSRSVPAWVHHELLPAMTGASDTLVRLFCQARLGKLLDFNAVDFHTGQGEAAPLMMHGDARTAPWIREMLCGLWNLICQYATTPSGHGLFDALANAAESESWFPIYMRADAAIRAEFARQLEQTLRIDSRFAAMIRDSDDGMMTDKRFYSWRVISLLQTTTIAKYAIRDLPSLCYDVVHQALRLRLYDQMELTSKVLTDCRDDVERARLFARIVAEISHRELSTFFDDANLRASITLSELFQCAAAGTDAMNVLRKEGQKARSELDQHFSRILTMHAPSTWLQSFKDAATIAFYIKYMYREDLELARRKFGEAVERVGDPLIRQLWEESSRLYSKPLVNVEHVDLFDKDVHAKVIDEVMANAAAAESAEMRIIGEITAQWMRHMIRLGNPPMTPHHTQIFATLMLARFYTWCGVSDANRRSVRSLIAQVGTGEGKSMIIAMLAIYLVKAHGRKVHILENNEGLLDRDYQKNADFIASFQVAKAEGGERETRPMLAADHIDHDADICYCLTKHIEYNYQDGVRSGNIQLSDAVLIVDEVDDLIVDEKPSMYYVYPDVDTTPKYVEFCGLVKSGSPKPSGTFSATEERLWQQAVQAKAEAEQKRMDEASGYTRVGSHYMMLDANGRLPRISLTSNWLVYLNFRDFGLAPNEYSTACCSSTPYLFNAYYCMVGLTGSVGGNAEKRFLSEVYSAKCFPVPSFLDTCTVGAGVASGKQPLTCVSVSVQPSKATQLAQLVQLALDRRTQVPVVIITRDNESADFASCLGDLKKTYDACLQRVEEQDGGAMEERAVQILAQLDPRKTTDRSMKGEWNEIVENATKRLSNGRYPITVTDAFGGRGHDFRYTDEDIDHKGGLLIIVTTIPHEREWTQWKGRTARQDHKGQYAAVLSAQDPPFVTRAVRPPAGVQQTESLVAELLEATDKDNLKKLNLQRNDLDHDRRVAHLCHAYYAKFPREPAAPWPCPQWLDQDRQLRDDVLEQHGKPASKMVALARQHGLKLDVSLFEEAASWTTE